jgi:hypothetical protein
LILIGHSFGGLVIQKAVVSASIDGGRFQYLVDSVAGIILLGTPNRGSGAQKIGSIISRAAEAISYGQSGGPMMDVDENSMEINDLTSDFTKIAIRKDLVKTEAVVCFYENKRTDFGRRAAGLVKANFLVLKTFGP